MQLDSNTKTNIIFMLGISHPFLFHRKWNRVFPSFCRLSDLVYEQGLRLWSIIPLLRSGLSVAVAAC